VTDRIIDVAETPARLRVRGGLLVIAAADGPERTFPVSEVGVLVLAHPALTCTGAVLSELASAGGLVVVCDGRRLPAAMLLPVEEHSTQAERFARQASAPAPTRKRLWRALVRAKIRAQAALLKRLRGDDRELPDLADRVRSGDPDNLEAQAARRYWPALFADAKFRRRPRGDGLNRPLDYGYGVLRAATARAVCAAGLHPSFGLHHHNRYDAFALADDLMEPFRPRVDAVVAALAAERGTEVELDREVKSRLIEALLARVELDGEERTFFDALSRVAASVVSVLEGRSRDPVLPADE
jgi:CRISPR-associated protein Cas1